VCGSMISEPVCPYCGNTSHSVKKHWNNTANSVNLGIFLTFACLKVLLMLQLASTTVTVGT
jgi:hypothetical protein